MPPAGFELALPATKQPQTYALERAATGIGEFGVTSFKVTDWEGKFDSEMNIAAEQRKAMCVHITRVVIILMFCNQVVFCIIITQREHEVSGLEQWDSGTCKFTLVIPLVPCSIPGNSCLDLKGVYLKLTSI
jgi:hypothetical protein